MGTFGCWRFIFLVNWYKILKFSQNVEYIPWGGIYDDFDRAEQYETPERDVYVMQSEADSIFEQANIRPGSQKEITQIADVDGVVAGALASTWYDTEEYGFPVKVFEMDVAVRPDYRGPQMIGLNLIKQGIQQYEQEKDMWEEMGLKTMMKSWVINPRLIDVLERRYGFEIESQGGEEGKNWAYMIRY